MNSDFNIILWYQYLIVIFLYSILDLIAIECLHCTLNFTHFEVARILRKIMLKNGQYLRGSYSAEYSVKTAEYSVFGRNQFFLFRSYTTIIFVTFVVWHWLAKVVPQSSLLMFLKAEVWSKRVNK